jgi:hypothetical protein
MRHAHTLTYALLALLTTVMTSHAQEETSCWRSDLKYVVGVKATSPQRSAISLGTFIPLGRNGPSLLLQAEPGYGGGKLNIGIGSAVAGIITAGGALKASLLHTWNDPVNVPVDQTYLGVELELMCCFINGSIGAYRRIDGDEGEEWIISSGIGIGF